MQFQADLLDREVKRPKNNEATALGAAYLAGLAVGYWKDLSEIEANQKIAYTYLGQMEESRRSHLLKEWKKAVQACCSYHPE
jgi:glycerol kinase